MVMGLCLFALGVAAALTIYRMAAGPTMLDRVIAMDVLVAIVVCGLGVEAAFNRHATTLPILVVLSLVGFVGSVSVARFAARDRT
ncbi:MAG: multiple resistance and pH regulation protein [Pseudonocardiales bacterium]|nr:multiple resistance and pH regulation protein [Jatrophihabitantaceae bacterium]MCW2603265.1 multiple resistance and pH regulation protein [Pseudonocardiales bacterium]